MSLLNSTGLSTQVPNLLELVTNNESTRVRDIYIGTQRIRARRARTKITVENASTLQFLDLMNSISPRFMDDTKNFMLKKYVNNSGVTRNMVEKYVEFFPAKAMKNMIESGMAYEIT